MFCYDCTELEITNKGLASICRTFIINFMKIRLEVLETWGQVNFMRKTQTTLSLQLNRKVQHR
jgi:hypothetical protein